MSVPSPDAQVVDREHPWLGLAAFTEETRAFFFGREQEEDELYRRIRRDRTTLFFGQSGLGKTSLLQAGLLPRLRDPPVEGAPGFTPVLVRLNFGDDANRLLEQLHKMIADSVGEALPDARALAPEQSLWEYLHHRDSPFSPHCEQVPALVLLFDQFEETFTLGLGHRDKRSQTQQFLIALSDLIEDRCPAGVKARLEQEPQRLEQYDFGHAQYRIVITIREDFLPQLEALRTRAPSLGRNRLRLTRMNGLQALEAVVGPGAEFIGRDAAEEIVRLVGRGRPDDPYGLEAEGESPRLADLDVEPPLLSLFCSELNERRLNEGRDRITADAVIGSRDAILQSFYERAFRGLPRRLRTFVERWLVSDSGYRESMAIERAERLLGRRPAMRAGLEELVRRRLLHVEEKFEVPCIELTHDLLTEVVMRSRERRRLRIRVGKWMVPAALVFLMLVLLAVAGLRYFEAEQDKRDWLRNANECADGDGLACARFESIEPRALAELDDVKVNSLVLNMAYAALKNEKNKEGSLKILTNALAVAEARPSAEVDSSLIRMLKGDVERRLGRSREAIATYEPVRAQYSRDLPTFPISGPNARPTPRLETLARLASINMGLATLLPQRRSALLSEALKWQDERVDLALDLVSNPRTNSDDPGASNKLVAGRLLVEALGDRAWTRVLANRPGPAIADADFASTVAPGPEYGWIRVNKADALLLKGDLAAAIDIFKKVLKEDETHLSGICGDLADMTLVGLGSKQIEAAKRQLRCGVRS